MQCKNSLEQLGWYYMYPNDRFNVLLRIPLNRDTSFENAVRTGLDTHIVETVHSTFRRLVFLDLRFVSRNTIPAADLEQSLPVDTARRFLAFFVIVQLFVHRVVRYGELNNVGPSVLVAVDDLVV